jgi:5S rRNA maturation endonuclease (ribonuclease M5)
MLNIISDFIKGILPTKKKTTPSGWTSFNAPCCPHNGESADTRGRGGLTANPDGSVSFHCFNCNFKASYQPGRHLTFKFRKLLKWLGADDTDIKRLVIEAIRVRELVAPEEVKAEAEEERIEFKARDLPEDAENLVVLDYVHPALEYCVARKIDIAKYAFYATRQAQYNLHKRIIIPFIWQGRTIGYTARAIEENVKPKYHSNYEPNFVFNINNQQADSKFVIVCEGPFDAMSIDGVAVLNNECNETQADIIESLGKEVIVVADRDRAGAKMINNAIEYGWTVSYPVWLETCKDINEATVKYGKLFVLKTILDSKQSSKLKIELMRKKLYN